MPVNKGVVDVALRLGRRVGNEARVLRGPVTGTLVVSVRPLQDLLLRQRRSDVSAGSPPWLAATLREELRQRQAAGQSSQTFAQRTLHSTPLLSRGTGNLTVLTSRVETLQEAVAGMREQMDLIEARLATPSAPG